MVINYSKQLISESDINSVSRTLRSDFLTTGPKIKVFEDLIKKKVKSKYSIVVNSATSVNSILYQTVKESAEIIDNRSTYY